MPIEAVTEAVSDVVGDVVSDAVSDTVTETTHVGFFQKLMNSLIGFLFGILLIAGSCWGLFWNEGRSVTTQRSLYEGAAQVVSVPVERIAPENEGKLVHITGKVATKAPLVDQEFQVSATGLVLARHVQMYQWEEKKETETKKNFGGSEERVTTYHYHKVWSSSEINSRSFKQSRGHTNPAMRYHDARVAAKDATVGAFAPSENVLRRLATSEKLPVAQDVVDGLKVRLGVGKVHFADGEIYLGADPANPAVGDIRVSYHVANPSTISIVGRQTGADFSAFQTRAGDALLFVKNGTVDAAQVFADALKDNRVLTWILRVVGMFAMLIGFTLLASPIVALGDIVPFIGNLLGVGALFLGLVMTAVVGPTVIAIAWFWYRPMLSVGIIAVGIAVAFLVRRYAPQRKPRAAASPSAASAAG